MASSVIFHNRFSRPTYSMADTLPSYRGPFSGHYEWREKLVSEPEFIGYRREVSCDRDFYGNVIRTTHDIPVYRDKWVKKLEKVWVED